MEDDISDFDKFNPFTINERKRLITANNPQLQQI